MSTNNPKTNNEVKADETEGGAEKPSQIFSDSHTASAHRSNQETIKSAFSSPLRASFSSGRTVIPVVSTGSIIPISSSTHASINNPQPVITKAVTRAVITENLHPTSTIVQHPSLIQGSALTVNSAMASIIRGPPHVQQSSTSQIATHATVQAPYSTHVPRGAAAVAACITNLKPPVATPIKGPHIFAPSIISSSTSIHSTVQKYSSTGLPLNACLQPRTTTLSSIRGTVLSTSKTLSTSLPVTSAPEIQRPSSIASNALPSSQLLLTSSRPSDGILRPAIIQGTATLPKPHSFVQQVSDKGHYKPIITPTSILSVQNSMSPSTTSSALSVQPTIVAHQNPMQPLSSTLHLVSHHQAVATGATSHESGTSPLTASNLSYSHSHLPKVVTQPVHTVAPVSHLHLTTTAASPAPIRSIPAAITTTVAMTHSIARPIVSTGTSSTASIPVAKVYPQPLTITSKPSLDVSQHQDVSRSVPSASLFVSSTMHAPSTVTTSCTTFSQNASGNVSITSSSVPSNVILTETKPERSSVTSHPPFSFPPGTTYFCEPLQGSQSALAMHTITGPSACHSFPTMPTSTLRTGLIPSNQPSSVTLHTTAVRPSISSRAPSAIASMVVTMGTSRHQLLAPSTFTTMENKHCASHTTDNSTATTSSYAVSGAVSYAGNSGQPVTNPTSSSSRPSILRKRAVDGSSVTVKKNVMNPMPVANPPSPRPEVVSAASNLPVQGLLALKPSKEHCHENGQVSENPDNCNGAHPITVIIKQEPPDTSTSPIAGNAVPQNSNRTQPITIEASPRKKPRKQQLTGNELVEMHSTEGEDDFEKDKELVKKEAVKEAVVTLDDDSVRWIPAKKRHPVTLLNSYRHTWKSRHNHFMRHSDIKLKDERRPTVGEIANQKGVVQKANGWKVYYICSQIDDLVDLEATVHSRLSSLLEILEKKPVVKEKEDVELSRASELMRGNIQRCKLIRDQMNDAKHQVLKVLDHKSKIIEIVGKFITSKPPGKKK